MEITSTTNLKVKEWTKLHQKKYRQQAQRFLIAGEHLLEEALKAEIVETVLIRTGSDVEVNFNDVYYVSDTVMSKLSETVSLVDVMAVCHYFDNDVNDDVVVLLDDIQDPGNIGTIIRATLSFGYKTVYLSNQSVDKYQEKLIRATQGALFHSNIKQVDKVAKLQELKKQGYSVYVTTLEDAVSFSEVKKDTKAVLVFGNEGQGVSEEVKELADYLIKIEARDFESLNVAVAMGIIMYEFRK